MANGISPCSRRDNASTECSVRSRFMTAFARPTTRPSRLTSTSILRPAPVGLNAGGLLRRDRRRILRDRLGEREAGLHRRQAARQAAVSITGPMSIPALAAPACGAAARLLHDLGDVDHDRLGRKRRWRRCCRSRRHRPRRTRSDGPLPALPLGPPSGVTTGCHRSGRMELHPVQQHRRVAEHRRDGRAQLLGASVWRCSVPAVAANIRSMRRPTAFVTSSIRRPISAAVCAASRSAARSNAFTDDAYQNAVTALSGITDKHRNAMIRRVRKDIGAVYRLSRAPCEVPRATCTRARCYVRRARATCHVRRARAKMPACYWPSRFCFSLRRRLMPRSSPRRTGTFGSFSTAPTASPTTCARK